MGDPGLANTIPIVIHGTAAAREKMLAICWLSRCVVPIEPATAISVAKSR